eukprot:CAMPEP_0202694674 /NCGR_PEP_ID=MMETSP1385-20130828/8476_1 /ASSEMBLY_ACC=CAM_ASM_000861 /TAXON_ID=933848 /ORGANISM="Elphidium margaritaceum" /LENGTH=252 /DNA_ID=CAMNT_0049350565 /DNA_START=14 /DNA_END=772 /DNA_ORIENTATION=+
MSAPAINKDLPSSPLKRGLYGQNAPRSTSTLRAIFQNKHVLNSIKWGFTSGTLVVFHTLYHSRGNIALALSFGTMAFCVTTPAKYWYYMRRQRHEFFRGMSITAQTQDAHMLTTGKHAKKVRSREAMYNPNQPYNDEEWEFVQKIKKRLVLYCIGGGSAGLLSAVSVLTLMNISRISPIWMRAGFTVCAGLSGAGLALRYVLQDGIKEASKWEKDGRLKQELKYVMNWLNSDENDDKNKPDAVKRKRDSSTS